MPGSLQHSFSWGNLYDLKQCYFCLVSWSLKRGEHSFELGYGFVDTIDKYLISCA